MKKAILFLILINSITINYAQDWFTSLEVAKKLALVQDKMLFVMWEESMKYDYQVIMYDENGNGVVVKISKDEFIENLIWENFVPVLLPEYTYPELSKNVKETKGVKYYNKLIDDNIKIMDVNGNILNIDDSLNKYDEKYYFSYLDFADFIKRYALNTSFMRQEFENYVKEKNFNTAFNLASKYLDYAIIVQNDLKPEIIAMANIYFDEAKTYLKQGYVDNSLAIYQRLELMKFKEELILNKTKKLLKQLKKLDEEPIDKTNESLFNFLNYTTFKLLNKEESAELWKNKVSSIDLTLSEMILNNIIEIGNNN